LILRGFVPAKFEACTSERRATGDNRWCVAEKRRCVLGRAADRVAHGIERRRLTRARSSRRRVNRECTPPLNVDRVEPDRSGELMAAVAALAERNRPQSPRRQPGTRRPDVHGPDP
jgi:hypothetical protein